eukprot:365949-Chlamydomonas_euryale.AAC.3
MTLSSSIRLIKTPAESPPKRRPPALHTAPHSKQHPPASNDTRHPRTPQQAATPTPGLQRHATPAHPTASSNPNPGPPTTRGTLTSRHMCCVASASASPASTFSSTSAWNPKRGQNACAVYEVVSRGGTANPDQPSAPVPALPLAAGISTSEVYGLGPTRCERPSSAAPLPIHACASSTAACSPTACTTSTATVTWRDAGAGGCVGGGRSAAMPAAPPGWLRCAAAPTSRMAAASSRTPGFSCGVGCC